MDVIVFATAKGAIKFEFWVRNGITYSYISFTVPPPIIKKIPALNIRPVKDFGIKFDHTRTAPAATKSGVERPTVAPTSDTRTMKGGCEDVSVKIRFPVLVILLKFLRR